MLVHHVALLREWSSVAVKTLQFFPFPISLPVIFYICTRSSKRIPLYIGTKVITIVILSMGILANSQFKAMLN